MDERRKLESGRREPFDDRTSVAFSRADDDQTGRGVLEPGHRQVVYRSGELAVVRFEQASNHEPCILGEVGNLGCECPGAGDVDLIRHEPLSLSRSSWWS